MKQRTKQGSSKPRFPLALLTAVVAVTCAKAEDQTSGGAAGPSGSSTGLTGTGVQNTTTISTAAGATTTGNTSGATGSNTSSGGTQGGEAGAPGDTGSNGSGGNGAGGDGVDGTGGNGGTATSTDGVPPDVIENAEIVLLYKVDSSTETTASIFMHLYLRNQSDDEFPLSAAEVRYWLDSDGRNYSLVSHYQGPGIGDVALSKGSDDEYVAVTFETGASLSANTTDINANEFQLKLDASGGNFDQSNDYSFAPALTSPTEHDRVTVYLAEQLVWGCEPSGRCAGDDPGAGGAAGAAGAEG